MTRFALTGATGFVGSHLLERMGDREVSVLVRGDRAAAVLAGPRRTIVRGGVEDARALDALVDGAGVVFHVAGLVAARSEAEFLAVNRDGTAAVARACLRAGARLVHVSSIAATGPAKAGHPVHDATWPRPVTPYGRSKLAGEQAIRDCGVAHVIVRPPVVYGPRDRQILRLFKLARLGVAPLLAGGAQLLSLVHAADLADALLAAADAPAGRVYHAAHPDIVTHRGFTEAVGRAVGRVPWLVPLPAAAVHATLAVSGAVARVLGRTTVLDPSRAGELLGPAWTCTSEGLAADAGWHARIPLAQGLAQTAAWYRAAGWL